MIPPPVSARRRRSIAAILALTVGLAACGLRTPVRPPEDTAPVIPGEVTVERDKGAAVLRWRRADRSADGQRLDDLAAFVIERRTDGGDAWQAVATIDVVDQEKIRRKRHFSWRDEAPIEGASYRVLAVCADGQQGPPAEAGVAPAQDHGSDLAEEEEDSAEVAPAP